VLYVGDHDPSGMYMLEVDLYQRLQRYGARMRLERLALTTDDVRAGDLPDYPAKPTDTRYRWYVHHFGHRAWELDAMSPVVLRERVEQAIRSRLDMDAWTRGHRFGIDFRTRPATEALWPQPPDLVAFAEAQRAEGVQEGTEATGVFGRLRPWLRGLTLR
jgi:hypothetical protein